MGRDRDPFDRTVAYLRERLAEWRPLQGAVISINGLAQTLDVSHTPVREALAMLAGEGLIARTPSGYAGATYTPLALTAHYDLADLLLWRAVARLPTDPWPDMPAEADVSVLFDHVVAQVSDAALVGAFRRVAAQLTPFKGAADQIFNDQTATRERLALAWRGVDRRALSATSRVYHARRRRAAARILASAVGLGPQS